MVGCIRIGAVSGTFGTACFGDRIITSVSGTDDSDVEGRRRASVVHTKGLLPIDMPNAVHKSERKLNGVLASRHERQSFDKKESVRGGRKASGAPRIECATRNSDGSIVRDTTLVGIARVKASSL